VKPTLTPLDREWLRLLDEADLRDLVRAVRAADTHLARRDQEVLRRAAAEAMERLDLDVYELEWVRLRLVPASTIVVGSEATATRTAHVRVKLDRRAVNKASSGANVVDLTARLRAPLAKTKGHVA